MKKSIDLSRRGWTALTAGFLSLAAAGVSGQGFERVVGPPATIEEGARVTPVRFCPGGGFIAMGTTTLNKASSNVHVVRTRRDGAPILERTYDVVGAVTVDRGLALAEAGDGSGFVIGGATRRAATTETDDVLLLKIDCAGALVWAFSYGSPGADAGLDVVEARTGSPSRGTDRGDILVAGQTVNADRTSDGLLLRTTSDGKLIWSRRYVTNGQGTLHGLTEARPVLIASNPTGDIVAAGEFVPSGGVARGFVVRVDGNDGTIGGLPHGAVAYGAGDAVSFESVVELHTPGLPPGSLVLAGRTFSPATASDVLLVRTSANPAAVLAAAAIGEPRGGNFGEEAALDLREVTSPLPAARPGDLALTGKVGPAGAAAADAFLLLADASSLRPSAPGQLFGDHADGLDSAASLAAHPNGFVLAGVSRSQFLGLGDPGDLYLVATDPSGQTSCSLPWDPPSEAIHVPVSRVPARPLPALKQVRQDVRVKPLASALPACPF